MRLFGHVLLAVMAGFLFGLVLSTRYPPQAYGPGAVAAAAFVLVSAIWFERLDHRRVSRRRGAEGD